jgi:iron complex transport system permease protein
MTQNLVGKRLLLLGGLCFLVLLLSGVSLMAGRVWVPWSAW